MLRHQVCTAQDVPAAGPHLAFIQPFNTQPSSIVCTRPHTRRLRARRPLRLPNLERSAEARLYPHKIQPVSGYSDLSKAGDELIKPMKTTEGGPGGVVVCLGVGGLVDLADLLGLEGDGPEQEAMGGVEVWVIDARRPWNLSNVFGELPTRHVLGEVDANARRKAPGVERGCIQKTYLPGR